MGKTDGSKKWGVLIATLLGSFTVILNNSLMNVAMPYFMALYELTAGEAQWIVTSFALAMAITMPLTGFLGKVLGEKYVYLLGMALFILGSGLGAISWNFVITIVFRFLQGMGGGLVMPLAMILIFQYFPKTQRGLAMGIWGVSAMFAPAIGPTLGGVVLNYSSWEMLFLINVPTALIAMCASLYFIPKPEERTMVAFDWRGSLFLSIGLLSLMLGIDRLQSDMNALWVGLLFVLGITAIVVFIWNERRVSEPLLDLGVFLHPVYSGSLVLVASSTAAMSSVLLLIPLLIQDVLGQSPLLTGFLLLPQALVMGMSMTVGGRILDRKGPHIVILIGMLALMSITFFLGFAVGNIATWLLVLCLIIHGFGNGFINTPATTAGMNALPEKQISAGAAVNNVLRQIMKVASVVFISMFYDARRGAYLLEMPALDAGILAVRQTFLSIGVLLMLTLPLIFFLRKKW